MSIGDEHNLEIKKTIVIDASPEVVFKAITEPEELTQWFPDQAILESKVGGRMKFSFYKDPKNTHRDMDYFPEGTITEFIPDKNFLIHGYIPIYLTFQELL
jgi:uncharacterized protein YndB with AHSA1/START domain